MNKNYIYLFLIFIIYFFDISNPDAIRQGTEGFYLLISNEMYEASSFLTPLVNGDHHWSKPPFHFWLPMPIFHFFTNNYLLAARVSIALTSLICLFFISLWYERELKRNWWECYVFLLTPIYFFKYSRIFMMEMPLALLTTLGSLYFYSFINNKEKKYLLAGSILTALSILIKGPVSLAMLVPGAFLYLILYKRKSFLPAFLFFFLATTLGSLWFIISYLKYGHEFFEYFFIRENLGKFNSKSYPITSVIQGLIIYSSPLIFFLPSIIKRRRKRLLANETTNYILLNFFFFYFLWFFPKQKSHHYAVPAIPLLMIFVSYHFHLLKKDIQQKLSKNIDYVMTSLLFLATAIFFIFIIMSGFKFENNKVIYLLGSCFILSLWFHPINQTNHKRILKPFILMAFLFNMMAPFAYLPTVPSSISHTLNKSSQDTIYVDYRKPFFVQQATAKKVWIVQRIENDFTNFPSGSLTFLSRHNALKHLSPDSYTIIKKWQIWKRGVKAKDLINALKKQDLTIIQDTYFIIQKL